ncbi:DNA-binding transcriptional regulator, CsgD family [Pseudovibrio denitrificans]|uniref:DNA-binding transcriptional regulator, CsgD family n=1 Tax=Pseudovibrio denitrificans TaxID=258256 RepID=A0A1I7DZC1_9HYPH|nr:LuxR family transcriptional regulator [Pseudovibrio denitrificans]SFU17042.1 DNA-binding transcriptional regulator, CsgD family [Pseudovibrio denitrificans]
MLEGKTSIEVQKLIFESSSMECAIEAFRAAYEVAHVTLHMAQTRSQNVDMPYLKTTYPKKWISEYILKGYVEIDPVVKQGFNQTSPFNWCDLEILPESRFLMEESIKFGIGKNGYSIPVMDRSGRKSLVSINSNSTTLIWNKLIAKNGNCWREISHVLHQKALIELYDGVDPAPPLSRRELECLSLTALGKDYKTIAILLGISEHTTRSYLKSLRQKFNCTNLAQAVSKAHSLGIL